MGQKRGRFFGKRRSFWGVVSEKPLQRWGSGGKIGGKARHIWCNLRAHLVQPSRPSGAAFTPIWCSCHAHLVQSSRPSGATFALIWGSLHPKEGSINKPSALGLVGKICIFAATSYRCGAHTIVLSRVPRKVLLTLRGLYSSCDYRLALTTSIYTLP